MLGFRRVVLGFSVVLKDCFWVYFMVFCGNFLSFFGRGFGKKMIVRKGKFGNNEGEVERISWGVLSLLAFEGVSLFYGKILVSRGRVYWSVGWQ